MTTFGILSGHIPMTFKTSRKFKPMARTLSSTWSVMHQFGDPQVLGADQKEPRQLKIKILNRSLNARQYNYSWNSCMMWYSTQESCPVLTYETAIGICRPFSPLLPCNWSPACPGPGWGRTACGTGRRLDKLPREDICNPQLEHSPSMRTNDPVGDPN